MIWNAMVDGFFEALQGGLLFVMAFATKAAWETKLNQRRKERGNDGRADWITRFVKAGLIAAGIAALLSSGGRSCIEQDLYGCAAFDDAPGAPASNLDQITTITKYWLAMMAGWYASMRRYWDRYYVANTIARHRR